LEPFCFIPDSLVVPLFCSKIAMFGKAFE